MKKLLVIVLLLSAGLYSCTSTPDKAAASGALSKDSVVSLVRQAFVFTAPIALMDFTKKKLTNAAVFKEGAMAAPVNQLMVVTEIPDAKFTAVVRPNADTYYHNGFLDLGPDALVLTVPNTNGRYYLLPMLDAYGNVFSSPGKRTTGTNADTFLITGPKWSGSAPAGMKVIKAPTNMVWLLGRIQVNSQADGDKVVVPIERKMVLTPLASWGKPYARPGGKFDSTLTNQSPNEQLVSMPVDAFFNYVNALMVDNPPAAADSSILAKLAQIGVGPGLKFDLSSYDTATQAAIKEVPKAVVNYVLEMASKGIVKPVNGWSVAWRGFGNYGTDYDLRFAVCYLGLGANLPEDAVYPSCFVDADGNKFDGANNYVMHFEKGKTPPVHGFWSLTMYNEAGFFIANPINRFAIGDRNLLKYNADSSVDLYFQHASPGKDKESNWLPAPAGAFNLMLRMYWPAEEFLSGNWTPPAVTKQK